MPIKSGRYFIINVYTENLAFLPNSDSKQAVQSSYKLDDLGEQWDIELRSNGQHTIKNAHHKQFAASGSRSTSKAKVQVIGWESPQTWLLQETRVKGQYTISTTDSNRIWGLVDDEKDTPITLNDAWTNERNWWIFEEVMSAEVAPALDNRRTASESTTAEPVAANNLKGDGFNRLMKEVVISASHKAAEDLVAPKCHEKTRKGIIQALLGWIRSNESLIWLNGAAGAGKSAIMHTLAEQCEKEKIALASFFFSRTDNNRKTMARMFATIAYQLMQAIPETQKHIIEVVERHPLVFGESLAYQLQQLIINPLNACMDDIRKDISFFLVMIDGLDECANRTLQCSLIKTLGNVCRDQNFPLIFIMASRIEGHIEMSIESVSDILLTLPLDEYVAQSSEDIRLFLNDNFVELREHHRYRHLLANGWPESSVIDQIVAKSSGQFIYASVVINYISSTDDNPAQRLDIIDDLQSRDPSAEHPFAHLDALYQHIFSQIEDGKLTKILETLAFPVLAEESRIDKIELVCQYRYGDVETFLGHLTSLITFKKSRTIEFLHASLPDFLLDETRSGIFHINSGHAASLACKLLILPPDSIQEPDWSKLLFSLLATASPTEQLHDSLLGCRLDEIDGKIDLSVQLCMDFFGQFDRLKFDDQRQIYHHFGAEFAPYIAVVWPSVDEKMKKLAEDEYPEFLDAIYMYTFSRLEVDTLSKVLEILTFPLLARESKVDVIEWACQFQSGDVERSLADLTSIITCKGRPFTITFLHASLHSFLLDKDRSGNYNINAEHAAKLASKSLRLPTQAERERDRSSILISLLATASATDDLYDSLLHYELAFYDTERDPFFPVQLCLEFLGHFDRLNFSNRRQIYHHFAAVFAPHITAVWWLVGEERQKLIGDKYPELQQRISLLVRLIAMVLNVLHWGRNNFQLL